MRNLSDKQTSQALAENQAKLRNLFAVVLVSKLGEAPVRTLRIRGWLLIAACVAVTAVVYCTIHIRSRAPASPQAVASAEDEVYEAVVRDIVTPVHGQAHISPLVFDDTVLTDLATGEDKKSCQERVRKRRLLEGSTPPYNSPLDKIYRVLTGGWWDTGSLRADTIQDFSEKSSRLAVSQRLSILTFLGFSLTAKRQVFGGYFRERAESFPCLAWGLIPLCTKQSFRRHSFVARCVAKVGGTY